MEQSVRETAAVTVRRQYATPTLVVHGTLVELTHMKGGGKSAGAPYGSANGHTKFPPKS
jgi:hypothetical protein